MKVPPAILTAIAPSADPAIVRMVSDHADDVLPRYGLTLLAAVQDFLTHLCVESWYFTNLTENLNYRAQRLVEVWPSRFPTVGAAMPYAHNPRALANKVYGGRMGNTQPDDGWTFAGKGLIQTTGRANVEALARYMRISVPQACADLTDPDHALECAAATYQRLGCISPALHGDLEGTIRHIRGTCTKDDLHERGAVLAKLKKVLTHI